MSDEKPTIQQEIASKGREHLIKTLVALPFAVAALALPKLTDAAAPKVLGVLGAPLWLQLSLTGLVVLSLVSWLWRGAESRATAARAITEGCRNTIIELESRCESLRKLIPPPTTGIPHPARRLLALLVDRENARLPTSALGVDGFTATEFQEALDDLTRRGFVISNQEGLDFGSLPRILLMPEGSRYDRTHPRS